MSAVLNLVEKKVCSHNFDGYASKCPNCRKEAYRANIVGKSDTRKTVVEDAYGRECLKCEQMKPWDEFGKDKHGYKEKTADCKPCRAKKHKEIYDTNPAVRRSGIKNRPDKLMRLYGVIYEQVVRTLAAQHGLCANHGCCKPISLEVKGNTPDRAVIDHDHKTGKFRAILCVKCNFDLGMIENNEARFLGLMDYKTKHFTE